MSIRTQSHVFPSTFFQRCGGWKTRANSTSYYVRGSWRDSISLIEKTRPMVIVVGGTKVPGEVFRLANYNISIGNQPHSEVAALGVFLESMIGQIDELTHFQGGEIQVLPSLDRKKVMTMEEE